MRVRSGSRARSGTTGASGSADIARSWSSTSRLTVALICHGPMSSGGGSHIVAVTPPNQYPTALWDELVRQGKLKYAGQGMYELVNS